MATALRLVVFMGVIMTCTADWVNLIRLEISDWALAQELHPPTGVTCTEKGKKAKSCHCWNSDGKPSGGVDDDCDGPKGCLLYGSNGSGGFNYTSVSAPGFKAWIASMGIPNDLASALLHITATPSANYATVNLTLGNSSHPGTLSAHVATARRDTNDTIWAGYAYGVVTADLITPEKRHVHAGDCHGTTRGMKKRDFTSDEKKKIQAELLPAAFKQVAKQAAPPNSDQSREELEAAFMEKWGHIITVGNLTADFNSPLLPPQQGRRLLGGVAAGVSAITGAWSSIVGAFKSSYSQQLEYEQLGRGWSKFKESTKVFKGAGLEYAKAPEFFKDIRTMIKIPPKYNQNFDQIIEWIQFFDQEYWSQHDTTWSIGKTGTNNHFTMFANNHQNTSKIDVCFLTIAEEFKLAPDIFVISQSHSSLGGLFSSTTLKFKKKPAAMNDEELTMVSQFFMLQAYQEIALAMNLPPPGGGADPFGPPPPPPALRSESSSCSPPAPCRDASDCHGFCNQCTGGVCRSY